MFKAALFVIVKNWKQSKCPLTGQWINRFWYVYTMELYSAVKKKGHNCYWHAVIWINVKIIIRSERSQRRQSTHHVILFIWTFRRCRLTVTENSSVVTWGWDGVYLIIKRKRSPQHPAWSQGACPASYPCVPLCLGEYTAWVKWSWKVCWCLIIPIND